MRKILSFLLVLTMLVSLAACSKGESDSPDPSFGVYDESTREYTNEFLGIGFKADDEWYVFSEDELADLTEEVISSNDELANALNNNGYAQLFYALCDDGLITANIVVENLGLVYGNLLDEKGYVEKAIDQVEPALESIGLSDIETEVTTMNFAGGEHVAITAHGSISGVDFYEAQVCLKVGRYMAVVTVGSYLSDETSDILSMFYGLE